MKSHRRELADFAPRDLVQDVAPVAAPLEAWTSMANMRSTGGGMERAAGETLFCNPLLFPPKFGMAVTKENTVYMLYAGTAGVAVVDGITHTNVSAAAGWADWQAGLMTGTNFNGYAVFNAPNRPPWYWDGGLALNAVKPLPGFLPGVQARCIGSFGSHIFAGSLFTPETQNERLAWSDAAAVGTIPASWVPTAENQAGDLVLSTGGGPINALRGLGSTLVVCRTTGAWGVQYVGRPYIYTARKLSSEVGAASLNSVTEVRGSLVILAPGDLVITDGTTLRSIGDARVKETIFSQLTDAGLTMSHVYSTPGSGEVVFCFALGNDTACQLAYVWNYERDKWSVRDLPDVQHSFSTYVPTVAVPNTWANDAGTWDSDFRPWDAGPQGAYQPRAVGLSSGHAAAFLLDEGDLTRTGVPVTGSLERLTLPLGAPDVVKLVHRIHPRLDGTPGAVLSFQVGAQLQPSDPVVWGAPFAFTIGTSRYVDCLAVGRYVSLRVSGAPAERWTLSGFTVEFDQRSKE